MRPVRLILSVCGFLCAVLPTAALAQQIFDSWLSFGLDRRPTSVFSADLDNDGDLDLVVGHRQGDFRGEPTVVVMENDGAGNFRRAATLHTSGRVENVFVFDLDLDGDLDIMTANGTSATANYFKNRGNGLTFESPYRCRTGFSSVSVIAGLLDDDLFPELIAANFGSGTLSIYKNRGAALYPSESTKVVGFGPRSVVLLDYDNDGDNDLATSVIANPVDRREGFNGFVLFENEGNGAIDDSARVNYKIRSLTQPALLDTLLNPWQLIAADFNNDGFADLALACSSSTVLRSVVCVFLNLQDGTFDDTAALSTPARDTVGLGCKSIAAVDVDGDGDLDLVSANQGDATVSVLKNNGNGTFAAKTDFLTPNNPPSVISGGDFDGDGDFDVAAVSNSGNSVAVMRNKGNGAFEVGTEFSTGESNLPYGIASANLDGDADVDLAICNHTNNITTIHKNNGSGSFPSPPNPATDWLFTGNPRSVAVADLDGDGDNDIAVANQATNDVSIFIDATGTGGFPQVANFTYSLGGGAFPYWITAADLDGDTDVDLATANFGQATVSVLKNNGNGTFVITGPYPAGSLPIYINKGDFDGDGDVDLVTANQGPDANPDSTTLLFNDGSGGFATRTDLQVGSFLTAVEAADLDGDGDCDLAVTAAGFAEVEDTAVVIFSNDGSGNFTKGQRLLPGAGPRDVIAADLNADGRMDLVTADSSRSAVSFFANTGGSLLDSAFAPAQQYGAGINPRFLTAADLDGDGDLDLAVTNLRMVTPPVAGQTHGGYTVLRNVGVVPRPLTRGDLNGDGVHNLTDVAAELNCVFFGRGACPEGTTDVNCNGELSAADMLLLLLKVFACGSFPS